MNRLVIKKILLYSNKEKAAYLPAPFDLFYYINNQKKEEFLKSNQIALCKISNKNYITFNHIEEKVEKPSNSYLKDFSFFNRYSKGNLSIESSHFIEEKSLLKYNHKIGIQRNKYTKSTEDAHLFRISMLELNQDLDLKLLVEINEIDKLSTGYLKLGGEGKIANYEIKGNSIDEMLDFDRESVLKDIKCSDIFKLVFITPLKINTSIESFFSNDDLHINVITFLTEKPRLVGGFDLVKGVPKSMLKAFLQGTVIYLSKPKEQEIKPYLDYLDSKLSSESQFGYGHYEIVTTKIKFQEIL